MAINLTYGTEGIKKKDYHVYIQDASATGVQTAFSTFKTTSNKANFEALVATLTEMGECRADSIELGIEDGDSIDGNVLGKIVLDKTGSMTAELINATPANIAELEKLDGKAVTVALKERETHLSGTTAKKTVIVVNNVNVSYSEAIRGGDSIRSTINIEKSVPTAGAFRVIADIDA